MSEGEYVPKSYQFERDMDRDTVMNRHDSVEFQDGANDHFLADNMDDLLNTAEGHKRLRRMLSQFKGAQLDRIQILDDYSKGNNTDIKTGQRRVDKNKADNRIQHNFGGYISSFVTGYLLGNPITLDEENLFDIHENNDINALNYDLGYDASRFGRAYELHYRDRDGRDNISIIDPSELFVIREASVQYPIIGAVHCPTYNGKMHITIYTDHYIYTYQPQAYENINFNSPDITRHEYGLVPVVEWWNNRFRTGDFEPVLSQINAYDNAQSDTANYMSDLNDATLVLSVDDIDSIGGREGAEAMADANIFVLENGVTANGSSTQGKAEYIYKQYDVQGTEKYKDRLLNDIFKLANIPNLDDKNFSGQQSGIAIQYKLIGLRQIQVIKERYFTKALRRRYKLLANIHEELNDTPIHLEQLKFTFHPNLPQDIWEEVGNFIEAGGELSQATLRELASFTDEATEVERLNRESPAQLYMSEEERRYGFDQDPPATDSEPEL